MLKKVKSLELNDRKKAILHAIVDAYIDTAEPVGSKAVAEWSGLGLSSATLRNEMAELEEVGLLEKPHTSAGRIPSQEGFRMYVGQLMDNYRMSLEEMQRAHEMMSARLTALEKLIERTSHAMSSLTNYTAVVTTPLVSKAVLKRIELLPMDRENFIVVMVLSGGMIKNRVCRVQGGIPEEALQTLSKLLNEKIAGRTVEEVTLSAILELRRAMGSYEAVVQPVVDYIADTLQELSDAEVFIDGAANLLDLPEYQDVSKAKEMLSFFKNESGMKSLLAPVIRDGGIRVVIGDENKPCEMKDASVVMGNYKIGNRVVGAIGVIGPVRMDYRRVVSHMEYFTKELNRLLFDIFESE